MAPDETTAMRNWRARLTPFQQRMYDRSASITDIPLTPPLPLLEAVRTLQDALAAEDHHRVESLAQTIVNHICWQLKVRSVRVQVEGIRPSNRRGELHGLYTHDGSAQQNTVIRVWMRTAKRGQVVAFRTFLRTLLHEVCHHLDYEYFRLRESYHTEGFFQRESSLFRALVQHPAQGAQRPLPSLSTLVREILAGRGQQGDKSEHDQ